MATASQRPIDEPAARPLRIIEPRQPAVRARLSDFWRYRQLVPYFGRRFLRKRYARTWLGRSWLFLRPLLNVGTQVLVFGGILGVTAGPAPYLLVFVIASSAWHFFAQSAYWATRSLEMSRRELKALYVPRLVPLVASLTPAVVEYLIYLAIAGAAVVYYVVVDGTSYLVAGPDNLLLPAGLLLCGLVAISVGLCLAPFAALARDVRFGLRYALSFWYFLTPVIYPLDAIPDRFRILASINPMTAPTQMVKRGLLGYGEIPMPAIAISLGVTAALFVSGLLIFSRRESKAVDGL